MKYSIKRWNTTICAVAVDVYADFNQYRSLHKIATVRKADRCDVKIDISSTISIQPDSVKVIKEAVDFCHAVAEQMAKVSYPGQFTIDHIAEAVKMLPASPKLMTKTEIEAYELDPH